MNDDNLRADITQTMHSIKVEGVQDDSKYASGYSDTFDVFIFTREEDYNCYIEASTIWVEHMQAKTCDFLSQDSVVKPQVKSWSTEDDVFLSRDKVHNDILVVLDNTNWLSSVSNRASSRTVLDVAY